MTTRSLPVNFGAVNAAKTKGGPIALAGGGNSRVSITITGLNVAIEHWAAFQALLPGYLWVTQNRTGQLMTIEARRALQGQAGFRKAILTGDTHNSIHHFLTTTPTSTKVSVGPTTPYAPMIEYGLASHSKIGPRPFMAYAVSQVIPFMVQAYADLASFAKFGARGKITSPPYKSQLERYIAKWRAFLYSAEKRLGDVAPLGGAAFAIPGTGALRGGFLGGARILGDIQAVLGKIVGLRFQRRLTGKVTGRLIGIGSRTVFLNKVVGARISGAERVYNRFAGKAVTRYIDQNQALSRFTGGR